jgi:hypothetical protein
MKQTAVEWLANEIYLDFEKKGDGAFFNDLYNQAKEMEKQQIIDARVKKPLETEYVEAEQYYKETYNK